MASVRKSARGIPWVVVKTKVSATQREMLPGGMGRNLASAARRARNSSCHMRIIE
jgi:hypothetical protein